MKIVARVLLTIGFLAASVGYSSWTAERTVLDPSATRGATHALLATPAVQTMLVREIRTALAPALNPQLVVDPKTGALEKPKPKPKGSSAGALKITDPKLAAAISSAVADPKFVAAFENAVMSLHEGLLSGGRSKVTLDTQAVTTAINQAIAHADPSVAKRVQKLKAVSLPIGSAELPKIGNLRHTVHVVGTAAIAIALLLVGGGLLLVHDRKTFRRAGRRIAFLAVPTLLVFLVLPHLLGSSSNSGFRVGGALLGSYAHRVLFSAGLLVVVGVSTWLIAVALPARRTQPEEETDSPNSRVSVSPRLGAADATASQLPERLYI